MTNKVGEYGSGTGAPATYVETGTESQAPGSALSTAAIWAANQQMEDLYAPSSIPYHALPLYNSDFQVYKSLKMKQNCLWILVFPMSVFEGYFFSFFCNGTLAIVTVQSKVSV